LRMACMMKVNNINYEIIGIYIRHGHICKCNIMG
jgi:hypothetical protein